MHCASAPPAAPPLQSPGARRESLRPLLGPLKTSRSHGALALWRKAVERLSIPAMNAVVPAIFSAVRLADGRWMLVGPNPERPYGPPWRNIRTMRMAEPGRRDGDAKASRVTRRNLARSPQ